MLRAWAFFQFLDLPSLVAVGASSKWLQHLSRGNLQGDTTSYYEGLYRKVFYFELPPLYWAPRSYTDWLVRFKARYTTRTWLRHEDRKTSRSTFGGITTPATCSPESPSDLVMQRSLDLRLEAALTGRLFFYPNFDRLGVDLDGPRDVNLMSAAAHPEFVAFALAYRSAYSARGDAHNYEALRDYPQRDDDDDEEEDEDVDEEEDEGDPSEPQIWFEPPYGALFVKQVLRFRPAGYGDRANSVCYWDASGEHIYHDSLFKMVTVQESGDMQHCPNRLAFGSIDAGHCYNGQMIINSREV